MNQLATVFWGLVIALVGFVLTRFTVTLAATGSTAEFFFAGILPLVLGLSLSAFGIILAVSDYDLMFVRTTALWCLLGAGAMGLFVLMTLGGAGTRAMLDITAVREQTGLSNFLIGGAVGGTLTGLYAAQNQRHRRELTQQANRLVMLNRLLRDKVINSATAIKGHADVLEEKYTEQSVAVVRNQSTEIIEIINDVKYLAETADSGKQTLGSVNLSQVVSGELEAIKEQHPEATVTADIEDDIFVHASSELADAVSELFTNAIIYSEADTPQLDVTVTKTAGTATLCVVDNGPGLPPAQQRLLEYGEIAEFDDPTTGFGLNIVRLLTETFNGSIETTVTDDGTTVELTLSRVGSAGRPTAPRSGALAPRVPTPNVVSVTVAAVIAGFVMAGVMAALDGDLLAIGSLYGIEDHLVAMITHEFHSIVFGLGYAGLLSLLPERYLTSPVWCVGLAVGLGVGLWVVAAGMIMPIWLTLVGVPAPLPNLAVPSLAGHIAWGVTLGYGYYLGRQWLIPRLTAG